MRARRAHRTVPVSAAPIEVAREEFLRAAASLGVEVRFGRSTAEAVRDDVGATIPLTQELVEFWSSATPIDVEVPFPPGFLHLFNPSTLAGAQVGYDGDTWDRSWVVIGDVSGDPVITDTTRLGTPVMLALHGIGSWSPMTVAPDPAGFLRAIAAWLRVLGRFDGENLDEHADFEMKPGFNEELRRELSRVLEHDHVQALLKYIST